MDHSSTGLGDNFGSHGGVEILGPNSKETQESHVHFTSALDSQLLVRLPLQTSTYSIVPAALGSAPTIAVGTQKLSSNSHNAIGPSTSMNEQRKRLREEAEEKLTRREMARALEEQNTTRLERNAKRKKSEDYCICIEPVGKSMVGCDICDNWFHPACVNLTKRELKFTDYYICPFCKCFVPEETILEMEQGQAEDMQMAALRRMNSQAGKSVSLVEVKGEGTKNSIVPLDGSHMRTLTRFESLETLATTAIMNQVNPSETNNNNNNSTNDILSRPLLDK